MGLKLRETATEGDDGDLIKTRKVVVPTGYRSPETGQEEFSATGAIALAATWETLYATPAGKTAYVSDIIIGNFSGASTNGRLGQAAATKFRMATGSGVSSIVSLRVPMKFTGTIQMYSTSNVNQTFNISGWIE